METFLFALGGYLIGSIPVAYLLARKRHGIDLRREGSRNIGARNAFEVTGNKRIGFAVLVLDMHKGIIPLAILNGLGYCDAIPVAAVTIVLGHCYPVWLKFHGGRGLATGGAIMLLISPVILLAWIVLYGLAGILRSQVHLQALAATLGCFFFELIAGGDLLSGKARIVCTGSHSHETILVILAIVLSRHIEPVYTLLRKAKA